jgi:hypothetical protein
LSWHCVICDYNCSWYVWVKEYYVMRVHCVFLCSYMRILMSRPSVVNWQYKKATSKWLLSLKCLWHTPCQLQCRDLVIVWVSLTLCWSLCWWEPTWCGITGHLMYCFNACGGWKLVYGYFCTCLVFFDYILCLKYLRESLEVMLVYLVLLYFLGNWLLV